MALVAQHVIHDSSQLLLALCDVRLLTVEASWPSHGHEATQPQPNRVLRLNQLPNLLHRSCPTY